MFDYIHVVHGSTIVEEHVTLMKFDTDYLNGVHERQQKKNVKGGGSPTPFPLLPLSSKKVPMKRSMEKK